MPSPKLSREEIDRVFSKRRVKSGEVEELNKSTGYIIPNSTQHNNTSSPLSLLPTPVVNKPLRIAWDLVLDVRYQDVFAISTRIKAVDPQVILKTLPSSQAADDTRLLLLRISESAAQAENVKLLRPPNALLTSSSCRIFLAARLVYAASRSSSTQRSIPITIAQIRTPGDPEVEALRKTWASVPPWTSSKPVEWFKGLLMTPQPTDAVRAYFGDSVAFYFSFLESYTQSLAIPAVLGLAFFFLRGQGDDIGEGTIPAVLFATANVVWAATFVKLWRRKENDLALLWGAPSEEEGIDDEDGDISLILDRGSMWSDTDDQLFGRTSTSTSSSSTSSTSEDVRGINFLVSIAREVFVSLPVMLLCVSAIVLFISGEESLRRLFSRDLHEWRVSMGEQGIFLANRTLLPRNSIYASLPNWFLGYILPEIPLLLFLIGVPILDMINTSVVKMLVKFERNTSSAAREASFVSKLALLRILNAHTAPLYVAFIEQDLPALRYRLMFKSVFELVAGNLIPLITTFISEQMAMHKVGGGGSGGGGKRRGGVTRSVKSIISTPQPTTTITTTPLQQSSSSSINANSTVDDTATQSQSSSSNNNTNGNIDAASSLSSSPNDDEGIRKRFSIMPLSPTSVNTSTNNSSNNTPSATSALSGTNANNTVHDDNHIKNNDDDDDCELASSVHVQLSLGEFSTDDEMLELLNQYSSIILFAAVFPLAAPLAMLHNALEQRSDALKLLHQKRPFPRRIFGVGEAWKRAFELVAVLGALTNAGLAGLSYLQTRSSGDGGVHHSVIGLRLSSLITTVTFEHVLLLLLTVIYGLIPNKTEATRVALVQQQKEFKKMLLTTQRQQQQQQQLLEATTNSYPSTLSPSSTTTRIVKTKSSLSLFNSNFSSSPSLLLSPS